MKLEEIAENHGLTPEGVDYALTQYQIVIREITHGMLSKLSYDAKDIIRTAQERWCDTCDLKEQEPQSVVESSNMYTGLLITHCPKCGFVLNRFLYGREYQGEIKHCPMCGKAVKWE